MLGKMPGAMAPTAPLADLNAATIPGGGEQAENIMECRCVDFLANPAGKSVRIMHIMECKHPLTVKWLNNSLGWLQSSDTTRLLQSQLGAILLEQNDEWAVQRSRYMTLETIGGISDGLPPMAA